MKIHFTSFFVLLLLFSFSAFAQGDREDVIYLKNGTIYRGTIIEQTPNVSYTIQVMGGSQIVVATNDIEKVAKEDKIYFASKPKPIFHYREKGYFFQAQGNLGLEFGLNVMTGYKFGQFGSLGIGGGIAWVFPPIGLYKPDVGGPYARIFAYYSGDILKKRITPFYNIYAGYGFVLAQPNTDEDYSPAGYGETIKIQGGPMGGVGLGAKFYSHSRRVYFSLCADLTIQNTKYWSSSYSANYVQGQNGYIYTGTTYSYYSSMIYLIIPTLNLGLGF